MKKIAIVFVILVFLFCLTEKVSAGGVYIDFEIPDPKTKAFADEFIREMQKKKILTSFFIGKYFVRGYRGATHNQKTGETESVIGIFVNEEEKPVVVIRFEELFSREEIKKKAKKASDYVFEYLKRTDEERKKSIKIPV
jgi:biopolymer transport protein ExbD